MTLNASGYQLFSISENFLTDLSTEDESLISGGSGGKSKGKTKGKTKGKSQSKSCGCGGYC